MSELHAVAREVDDHNVVGGGAFRDRFEGRLTLRSLQLWRQFELPAACERQQCGALWVAEDDAEMAEAHAKAGPTRRSLVFLAVTAEESGLLGADYARLCTYVERLKSGAARGRSVDDILAEADIRRDFLNEVSGWATSYEAPTFGKDEKNLVKLKAFMAAKLP